MKLEFTIILHSDEEQGGYWVTVPSLPGCISQGDTIEEAISNAREAIKLHVEGLKGAGEPVPEEREHPQTITISVAAPQGASFLGARGQDMKTLRYSIILHPDPDESGYTVTVPALPGVVTEGDTLEEAITNARDAIQLHIEALAERGLPVPEEKAPLQVVLIDVAA